MELWVDVDGTTYLHNTTAAPLSFDGYQIVSENNRLDPAGWKSISDYVAGGQIAEVLGNLGAGGLTFGEANPGPGNLAELNLGGAGTLQAGAKFSIGKPFLDFNAYLGANAFYKVPGESTARPMDGAFPEPSTWLLAVLAAAGLAVIRRRSRS
ncbi:MAG: PEP-CTERM sorting domain-containing protein [Pirellulales bacterium]